MKKIVLGVILVLFTIGIAACTADNGDDNGDGNYTIEQKEELLVKAFVAFMSTNEGKSTIQDRGGIVSTSPQDPSWNSIASNHPVVQEDNSDVTLRFGGSTSVQSIAQALSAQFSSLAGNFVPEHDHTGSGAAVARTQGADSESSGLHIAFASRDFSAAELDIMAEGTYGQLSWDAVVAVVHPSNLITDITAEILKSIYEEDAATPIRNWSDVPGSTLTGDITPYTRDGSSGTREAFFSIIGFSAANSNNDPLVEGFNQVESNGAMISNIAADTTGIGYISLASLSTNVRGLNFGGVEPTEENVLNDSYALKRPFMYVVRNYN